MPESRAPISRPYIVASPLGAAGDLETAVSLERIDPHRLASEPFLDLVERIAEAIHPGIFPRWAIYDCVEVPGGVIGLAVDARDASPTVRDALQIPTDYDGLVPVSVVNAVPMLGAHTWHVYGLGALEGDAAETLDLAIAVLDIQTIVGTTAWSSTDLGVHARLGPLELLTAWTPAHGNPATLTYRISCDGAALPKVSPSTSIACNDCDALRDLQHSLESGSRFRIVGLPLGAGDELRVPLEAMIG